MTSLPQDELDRRMETMRKAVRDKLNQGIRLSHYGKPLSEEVKTKLKQIAKENNYEIQRNAGLSLWRKNNTPELRQKLIANLSKSKKK